MEESGQSFHQHKNRNGQHEENEEYDIDSDESRGSVDSKTPGHEDHVPEDFRKLLKSKNMTCCYDNGTHGREQEREPRDGGMKQCGRRILERIQWCEWLDGP